MEATSRLLRQVTWRDRCKGELGLSVGSRSPAEVSEWGRGGAKEGGREERGQVTAGRGSDYKG